MDAPAINPSERGMPAMDDASAAKSAAPLPQPTVLWHNFLGAARRLAWLAALLAVLAGGLRYGCASRSYRPVYRSSAVFSVTANYAGTTDLLSYNTYLNIAAASNLAATFPYVIASDTTHEYLRRELNTDVINATLTATATADSALFTMTAQSTSPQDAYDVLLAAVAVYPHVAGAIIGDTQLQIINLPSAPSVQPVNRSPALRQAVITAVIVLLIGLGLILLLSLTRRTVHSAEDLHRLVNLKCLAYLPAVRKKRRSKQTASHLLLTDPRVDASFSESIRNLRIKLLRLTAQRGAHVLMVTSTLPNEGKSTVATNLALSLAAEGKRVILVDGDLRKQSLKATLGLDAPSDGLVEMLSGSAQNARLLTVPGSSLLLLSGDKTDEQPQRLLDCDKMRRLMALLRTKLDYVIIDSPPAGILSDAATIASSVDAALYVVRQDLASAGQIQDSIQALAAGGVDLLGCVLNCTQAGTTRRGYGGRYSGYAYGYKYADSYSSHRPRSASEPAESQ